MKIRRSPVLFHNLLAMTDDSGAGGWQSMADELRSIVYSHGLYVNAPILYQRQERAGDKPVRITVYAPINRRIEAVSDPRLRVMSELCLPDALTFRLADIDGSIVEEAYILLEACAAQQGIHLIRPYYHVCMDLYGDLVLDVVAPVGAGEEAEDGTVG